MQWALVSCFVCISTAVFGLAACSREDAGAMAAYEKATFQAGTGLGDITLGMTLTDFVAKFGEGRADYIAGDTEALELNFSGEKISFFFSIEGDCRKDLAKGGWWRGQGVVKWTDVTPSCKNIPLTSISVAEGGFFEGKTNQGVRLGDPITKAYAHGEMFDVGVQDQLMAGLTRDNPENHIDSKEGIRFYYTADDPNKLESTVIRRMTVFKQQ
jgi:hypothetical protein